MDPPSTTAAALIEEPLDAAIAVEYTHVFTLKAAL